MKDSDIKVVGLSSSKTKGGTNWKVMGAIVGIVVLALGVIAGIILVKQQQNIEEKAACTAACPNSAGQLVNCYDTADTNGDVSVCNQMGRVEICGQNASNARQYCCPAAGGTWTTDLTKCNVSPTSTATATAVATVTPTSTSSNQATMTATPTSKATVTATSTSKATVTATATSKSTATAKASSSGTAVPVPVTGVEWPTMLGAGFGIIMILASMALAL